HLNQFGLRTFFNVINQNFHTKGIVEVDEKLVVRLGHIDEAQDIVSFPPLAHGPKAIRALRFAQLLDDFFSQSPSGQRKDDVSKDHPGKECGLVENAPVPSQCMSDPLQLQQAKELIELKISGME